MKNQLIFMHISFMSIIFGNFYTYYWLSTNQNIDACILNAYKVIELIGAE